MTTPSDPVPGGCADAVARSSTAPSGGIPPEVAPVAPAALVTAVGPVLLATVIGAATALAVLLLAGDAPEDAVRATFGATAAALMGQWVEARHLADHLPLVNAALVPYGFVLLSASSGAAIRSVRRVAASRRVNVPMLVTGAAVTLGAVIAVRVVAPEQVETQLRVLPVAVMGLGTWLLTTWASRSIVARRVLSGFVLAQLAAVAIVVTHGVVTTEDVPAGELAAVLAATVVVGLATSAALVVGATVYPILGAFGDGFAGMTLRDGAAINEWVWLLPIAVIVTWLLIGYRIRDVASWRVVRARTLRAAGVAVPLIGIIGTTGHLELDGERIGLLGMPFRAVPSLLVVTACLYVGIYVRGVRARAPWATLDGLVADARDLGRETARSARRLRRWVERSIDEAPAVADDQRDEVDAAALPR